MSRKVLTEGRKERIRRGAARTAASRVKTIRVINALKKRLSVFKVLCLCVACTVLFTGCAEFLQWDTEVPHATSLPTLAPREEWSAEPTASAGPSEQAPAATPEFTDAPTSEPTAAPQDTEAATPEPTPESGEKSASLGFAGDLLFMQAQIAAASTGSGYDFKDMFRPMQPLFESVDFMVLNFEGTLAGAAAGYTQPKPTDIPPTEENPNPPKQFQRFNAPDEVVGDLMALGVDGFSTANNHCLDKGVDGLLRTIEVMDRYGAFHTGTYSSAERFGRADIVELNGISVGFVSATHSINSYDALLTQEQSRYMITRLYNDSMTAGAIKRCRDQGADIVVVLAHWGKQYQTELNYDQSEYTQKLISWGADAIIGCHPHVPQTIKWVTGVRDGMQVRVPVAYSMGNFISNMSRGNYPVEIGMFVRLDVVKTESGAAAASISYVPTYDWLHPVGGRYLNEIIPCFRDMSAVPSLGGLSGAQDGIAKAKQLCSGLVSPDIPQCKNPMTGQ